MNKDIIHITHDDLVDTFDPEHYHSRMKVAVCEYLLAVNKEHGDPPFIPPTAIDWLGDGIVHAIVDMTEN